MTAHLNIKNNIFKIKLTGHNCSLSVSVLNNTLAIGRNLENNQVLALEDVNSKERAAISLDILRNLNNSAYLVLARTRSL